LGHAAATRCLDARWRPGGTHEGLEGGEVAHPR
jgi:hypothetical protein